jgi:hypothetical protein
MFTLNSFRMVLGPMEATALLEYSIRHDQTRFECILLLCVRELRLHRPLVHAERRN